jgi:hypothetical protein
MMAFNVMLSLLDWVLLEIVIVTGHPPKLGLFTTTTTYPVELPVLSSSVDGVVVFVTIVLAFVTDVVTLNVASSPVLATVKLKLTFCPDSADPTVLFAVTVTVLGESEIVDTV